MRYTREKQRKEKYFFDKECVKRKRETRGSLRDFGEKFGDGNGISNWEKRKMYEKIKKNKRNIWQKKEAQEINELVRKK